MPNALHRTGESWNVVDNLQRFLLSNTHDIVSWKSWNMVDDGRVNCSVLLLAEGSFSRTAWLDPSSLFRLCYASSAVFLSIALDDL